MPNRIETLTQIANQMERPLSSGTLTHFADGTEQLADELYVDHEQIATFMQDHGVQKPDLQHTLISLHPAGQLPNSGRSIRAFLANKPKIFEDQIYYPHIALGVHVKSPNIPRVNNSLRHELCHLIQESTELAYHSRRATAITRAAGYGAIALAISESAGVFGHDLATYVIAGGLTLVGGAAASNPTGILYTFSRQEMEASSFAREHEDVQPISLLS